MKKKSLSAKKINHKNLFKYLKNPRINKIYNIFKKNLKIIKNNKKIAAAISGGADSLALAYFLKCYSLENKVTVYYYHLDHKLRKTSTDEAKKLINMLKKFNIKCELLTWRGKKPKSNIQAVARSKRYFSLFRESKNRNINIILTAHHQDDLYENFFLRILRGSGLEGMVSFNSIQNNFYNNLILIRPLINIKKKELLFISKKIFSFYINDPSNEDEYYKRIRIRKLINKLKIEGLDLKKLNLTINNLSDSNKTINYYVNENLNKNAKFIKKKSAYLLNQNFFNTPEEIIFKSLSRILRQIGNRYYSSRGKSLKNLVKIIKNQNFKKTTLSGCIIEKLHNSAIIYKE